MAIPTDYTGRRQVALWIDAPLLRRVDAYKNRLHLTRSAALTLLVQHGLENTGQTALDFDLETGDIA